MKPRLFSAILAAFSLLCVTHLSAQNTFPTTGEVGIGTTAPLSSSLLEVRSSTKGVLLPRMTAAQRAAIAAPATGLLVYQTDGTAGLYYYDAGWKAVTPATSGFATRALSNLTTTAINIDLRPQFSNKFNLGTAALNWRHLYMGGSIYIGSNRFISTDSSLNNTHAGLFSGISMATGFNNTTVGFEALNRNTTGHSNTAIGTRALYYNLDGYSNTAIGDGASHLTTDRQNTAIGVEAGYYNTSRGTFVGAFAYALSGGFTNVTALGFNAWCTASDQVRIGNASVTSIGGYTGWSNISDGRFKKDLKANVPGLDFIKLLQPVTYTLLIEEIEKTKASKQSQMGGPKNAMFNSVALSASQEALKMVHTGFVAQDVEAAAKKVNYDFSGVDKPKNENDFYSLRYAEFVVPLVKAVQELDVENTELKERISKLEDLVARLANGQPVKTANLKSSYLEQNSPNPVNGTTTIRYSVPEESRSARLILTNAKGQIVKAIALNNKGAGQVNFSTSSLATGTYQYTLHIDGKQAATKRLIVAR